MFERPVGGEGAILVHIVFQDARFNSNLTEFIELARSARAEILEILQAKAQLPNSLYFMGVGKIQQLKEAVIGLKPQVILFNHSLMASQVRNLEKKLDCRVVDRTTLILDIFAARAESAEGKLQVEVAQLKHLATRLVRGWTHLERQKGGIGLRGPGETQLESDKRLIRTRIQYLSKRLAKLEQQRRLRRSTRQKARIPTVVLVGYTNSGKSTLFNKLTNSNVYAENQLFATLDPTFRTRYIPEIGEVIFIDTVGFIRDLPHNLIEAFKATLEETLDADLLLHVMDITDEQKQENRNQVEKVLDSLGALALPRIEVYNKIDALSNCVVNAKPEGIVWISAKTGKGFTTLEKRIVSHFAACLVRGRLRLLPKQGNIRALLSASKGILDEQVDKLGNFILQISVHERVWQKICAQDPQLSDYFDPMC